MLSPSLPPPSLSFLPVPHTLHQGMDVQDVCSVPGPLSSHSPVSAVRCLWSCCLLALCRDFEGWVNRRGNDSGLHFTRGKGTRLRTAILEAGRHSLVCGKQMPGALGLWEAHGACLMFSASWNGGLALRGPLSALGAISYLGL